MPVVTLILSAGALGDEGRESTLSFLLVRPIRRSTIVGSKLLAAWLCAVLVVGASGVAAATVLGLRAGDWSVMAPTTRGGGDRNGRIRRGVPGHRSPHLARRPHRPRLRVRVGVGHQLRRRPVRQRVALPHRPHRLHGHAPRVGPPPDRPAGQPDTGGRRRDREGDGPVRPRRRSRHMDRPPRRRDGESEGPGDTGARGQGPGTREGTEGRRGRGASEGCLTDSRSGHGKGATSLPD
jgi:hypothetical protein